MYYVYGIKNCDTVKKALKKLDQMKVTYEFCDFKKGTLNSKLVKDWKKQLGDFPVNPKGRVYKQLKEEFESASSNEKVNLILENTSMVKRPVLIKDNKIICLGFDEEKYQGLK